MLENIITRILVFIIQCIPKDNIFSIMLFFSILYLILNLIVNSIKNYKFIK